MAGHFIPVAKVIKWYSDKGIKWRGDNAINAAASKVTLIASGIYLQCPPNEVNPGAAPDLSAPSARRTQGHQSAACLATDYG